MLFNDSGINYFAIKAGMVSLKLHNHKDIFYADDVCAFEAMPDYEALIGINKVGFGDGNFSTEGTELTYLDTDIDRKDTIIEGYYADTMPIASLIPYEVKIYIRYEEEEETVKEKKR